MSDSKTLTPTGQMPPFWGRARIKLHFDRHFRGCPNRQSEDHVEKCKMLAKAIPDFFTHELKRKSREARNDNFSVLCTGRVYHTMQNPAELWEEQWEQLEEGFLTRTQDSHHLVVLKLQSLVRDDPATCKCWLIWEGEWNWSRLRKSRIWVKARGLGVRGWGVAAYGVWHLLWEWGPYFGIMIEVMV